VDVHFHVPGQVLGVAAHIPLAKLVEAFIVLMTASHFQACLTFGLAGSGCVWQLKDMRKGGCSSSVGRETQRINRYEGADTRRIEGGCATH
jgi:hypothetical protein